MRLHRQRAFARAGLLGNPSDGYFGKTIALPVRNFRAHVVLYEWPELEIVLAREDRCSFGSLEELAADVRQYGYFGGLALVKATIRKFAAWCEASQQALPKRNFSLRYESDIPRQVGLAGSSAIITATLRALMEFYDVSVPLERQPNLVLSVEQEELGIAGGLQDRVCQTYEKLLYMDFRRDLLEGRGYGDYQELDPALLPPLYIAYDTQLGHAAKFHNNVRERWKQGDPEVVAAMQEFAGFAERGRQALLDRDYPELERLINANFDLRRRIYPLDPRHIRMVEIARELGAAAKFAGSGGSVIGTYRGEAMFQALQRAFQNFGCQVIKPA